MALLDHFSLQGRTALITGGSRGIGRAIALAYAEAGARVVCAARTAADVEQVAAAARAHGNDALGIACDVTDEAQLDRLVAQTLERFGAIDILVNNAGGGGPNDALKTSAQRFDAVLHFNVTVAFTLSAKVVPHMQAGQGGSIINIRSAASRYAQKHFSAYGSAKAALNQMTRMLAAEFAPQIRVNAIAPGGIQTDALDAFLDDAARERMLAAIPLRSMGQTEDVALAALYLASPAARWITGKVLEIDGGAEASTWPF